MTHIPQFVPYWGDIEKNLVLDVLESDYLNENKTVRKFEEEFAKYVGATYCVTVPSGTIALYLALLAYDRKDVVIPDHDGIFAFNAARAADKNRSICSIDKLGLLESDNEGRIAIHANGRVTNNVSVVEDCSQATFHHTKGKISTYSFASTKQITTFGQGGAICCDDKETFDKLTRLKDHGRNDRQLLRPMSDNYDEWGLNFKFTEVQAAFGLGQMRHVHRRFNLLGQMVDLYYDILKNVKGITLPDSKPKWYVDIFCEDADRLKALLSKHSISLRSFPKPLHMQPVAKDTEYSGEKYNSLWRFRHGLYLPSTTNLEYEEVQKIAEAIRAESKKI